MTELLFAVVAGTVGAVTVWLIRASVRPRLNATGRTVHTVDELEALPVGSIVRHESDHRAEYGDGSWDQGAVAEKRLDASEQPAWFFVGKSLGFRSHQADILPADVLYRPPFGV